METSYFAKYRGGDGVNIARFPIKGWAGRCYPKLYPSASLLFDYKANGDKEEYVNRYYYDVLGKLNAEQVFSELGENAVLLCYEKSGAFCHRRIVAQWLEDRLDIDVPEFR